MPMDDVTKLMVEQLRDAYSAEKQGLRAMPRVAKTGLRPGRWKSRGAEGCIRTPRIGRREKSSGSSQILLVGALDPGGRRRR